MYIQLMVRNDWAFEYLAIPGETKSSADAPKFEVGRQYRIEWPDGFKDTVVCAKQDRNVRCSDHGSVTDVTWPDFGFQVNLHGFLAWVSFRQVKIHRDDLT